MQKLSICQSMILLNDSSKKTAPIDHSVTRPRLRLIVRNPFLWAGLVTFFAWARLKLLKSKDVARSMKKKNLW
jgi:hypothetical protein